MCITVAYPDNRSPYSRIRNSDPPVPFSDITARNQWAIATSRLRSIVFVWLQGKA